MISKRPLLVCAVAVLALASACGGDSDTGASEGGAPDTAASGVTTATVAPAGQTTTANRAGSVDVCGLLSAADASDVAGRAGLGGGPASGATYALTATKVATSSSIPMSACKFHIDASSGGSVVSGGTVVIEVVSSAMFAAYKADGTPVSGLGDEAVSGGGTAVVRVGDLMMQTSENSFGQTFVVELYRKMAPKLK